MSAKKDPALPGLFRVAGEEIAERFGKEDVPVADKLFDVPLLH